MSICTRRCSAIPEMWPPSALWPTSTLTAAKIRELAESLARQSVALRPEYRNGWLVLSRALEVQGRLSDAREALLKAGEL